MFVSRSMLSRSNDIIKSLLSVFSHSLVDSS